jgi:hypothetical protein
VHNDGYFDERVAARYDRADGEEFDQAGGHRDDYQGRTRGALPALIDGEPGAVWAMRGQVRAAFVFTIAHGKIAGIDLVMPPAHLVELDVEITEGNDGAMEPSPGRWPAA